MKSCKLEILSLPNVFEKGNMTLWSSEYIAKNVLNKHLDENIDCGSRKGETIQKTILWISKKFFNSHSIVDIGCGPGLYGNELYEHGFSYLGIDISPFQIDFAKKNQEKTENIKYVCGDFLDLVLEKKYDVALMLYAFYSFFPLKERIQILTKLREHLDCNGCVIVEVFTKYHYLHRQEESDWNFVKQDGFWSENSYLELNSFHKYLEENVILIQAACINDSVSVWNSWIQIFDLEKLKSEFNQAGFTRFEVYGSCDGRVYDEKSDVICMCAYV